MHPLVQMQHVTRQELLRGLRGLSDADACQRVEPMNTIGWIIGHLANQQHAFFVAWPNGRDPEGRYAPFGYGAARSRPTLDEVMSLWRESCAGADVWLDAADENALGARFSHPDAQAEGENAGTLLTRNIFHTWCHIGEISAIRQMLGHRPPEFVDLHGWAYTPPGPVN